MSPPAPDHAVGVRVRVAGLLAKPELNGKDGCISEFKPGSPDRWMVSLDSGGAYALKQCNLRLLPGPSFRLVAGSAALQGLRSSQEDRHIKIPDLSKAARALKMP
ncbi:unnamed protein product, partial [Polarella glacialis]